MTNKKILFKKIKLEINNIKQLKSLCLIVKENKDKKVSITINDNKTTFVSLVGQKKFVKGFSLGFNIASANSKILFESMQKEINNLKSSLGKIKNQINNDKEKYRENLDTMRRVKAVSSLRVEAYKDMYNEVNDDRKIMYNRLDKIEQIIELTKSTKIKATCKRHTF